MGVLIASARNLVQRCDYSCPGIAYLLSSETDGARRGERISIIGRGWDDDSFRQLSGGSLLASWIVGRKANHDSECSGDIRGSFRGANRGAQSNLVPSRVPFPSALARGYLSHLRATELVLRWIGNRWSHGALSRSWMECGDQRIACPDLCRLVLWIEIRYARL